MHKLSTPPASFRNMAKPPPTPPSPFSLPRFVCVTLVGLDRGLPPSWASLAASTSDGSIAYLRNGMNVDGTSTDRCPIDLHTERYGRDIYRRMSYLRAYGTHAYRWNIYPCICYLTGLCLSAGHAPTDVLPTCMRNAMDGTSTDGCPTYLHTERMHIGGISTDGRLTYGTLPMGGTLINVCLIYLPAECFWRGNAYRTMPCLPTYLPTEHLPTELLDFGV